MGLGKRAAALLALLATGASASVELPRVATIYFGKLGSADELRDVARHDFVITNLYGTRAQMQSVISTLRDANPRLKLGTYTVLVELRPNAHKSDRINQPALQAVETNDWWVRNAAGERMRWTEQYGTYLINTTHWAKADEAGRRWPQWLAEHQGNLLKDIDGLDYVYVDNVWSTPRPRGGEMDWKRIGTNQSNADPEIQAAYRRGTADYWDALRKVLPDKKIIGNPDNDLDYPEFKGKLEGAFLECMMGKSWSYESGRGWAHMMAVYRSALKNTVAPKDVVFQVCSNGEVDQRLMRYGLASALLDDGWFAYTVTGMKPAPFLDEYSAPIGKAAEPPPTAAARSGVWIRRYTNRHGAGQSGARPASVTVGEGYRRLHGRQDPAVNDGRPVTTVTLPPKDGLVLLKQ